jgi:hypothetical protein
VKLKLILISLITLIFCSVGLSQQLIGLGPTNEFFKAGQITYELAPTVTGPIIADFSKNHTYGYSGQVTYYQSAYTFSGIELGLFDARQAQDYGLFDHITAITGFRLIPFTSKPFNRLSLEFATGATTWLANGNKSIDFDVGINYALTSKIYIAGDWSNHFLVVGQEGTSTIRVGLKFSF